MKLITIIFLLIRCAVHSQKYQERNMNFPPQFQSLSSGVFASDNTMYLPPESHTTVSYFPVNNANKLPFQYLPPTGTRAPPIFPSPYPMVSSTLLPHFNDDDEDDDNSDINAKFKVSSPMPPMHTYQSNNTENILRQPEDKREVRSILKPIQYQQPVDRIDIKFQGKSPFQPPMNPSMKNFPKPQNLMMSHEIHRNDKGFDQLKSVQLQNHYIGPGVPFGSTTEPAIPILRLSNEMDLDGSFSYEALGADQTHYMQHSHMENAGTDKEEQVVEGSYSYVGDNGQTYTVHYIADSNGFRASGDHLPVAPPIPEIIQRAVQYNLAEEAKKPPNQKSWQEDKGFEVLENPNRIPIRPPPTRNLFTGRTPEAFSFDFAQGGDKDGMMAAASSQLPVKTVDFVSSSMNNKGNNLPQIGPQITFLASQGAHIPSLNPENLSRMTTEKPPMPQLLNYASGLKQAEQDNSKDLWRWQYGLNANLNNIDQVSNKNTISRSSGAGDDIEINFSDMTQDQYTRMLQSQYDTNLSNPGTASYIQSNIVSEQNQYNKNQQSAYENVLQNNQNFNYYYSESSQLKPTYIASTSNPFTQNELKVAQEVTNDYSYNSVSPTPEPITTAKSYQTNENFITPRGIESAPSIEDNYNVGINYRNNEKIVSEKGINNRVKLITERDFVPPSETITQSYDYDNTFYEPRRIKAYSPSSSPIQLYSTASPNKINDPPNEPNFVEIKSSNEYWENSNKAAVDLQPNLSVNEERTLSTTSKSLKFTDFITKGEEDSFKPIISNIKIEPQTLPSVTTTEDISKDIMNENIFLKNIFQPDKKEIRNIDNVSIEEPKVSPRPKVLADQKVDKLPKLVQHPQKPHNDIKLYKKKSFDLADIFNFVAMKNQFESGKVKSNKNRPINNQQRHESRYIPVEDSDDDYDIRPEPKVVKQWNNQPELRGVIKNYKVLQRNNNVNNSERDHRNMYTKDLMPPKNLHSPNAPPLGRAGPSMKSYLPPVYV